MNRTVASIGLCMLMGLAVRTLGQDPAFTYRTDGNSFTSNVFLNDLPARAYRHFRRTYPAVSEERWMKTALGYSAYFGNTDSIFCHVLYDRAGHFEKALIYYASATVPQTLRQSMKDAYFGYSILCTSELDEGQKKTYEIMLADDATVKVIDLSDQDISTVYEYRLDGKPVSARLGGKRMVRR